MFKIHFQNFNIVEIVQKWRKKIITSLPTCNLKLSFKLIVLVYCEIQLHEFTLNTICWMWYYGILFELLETCWENCTLNHGFHFMPTTRNTLQR